MKVLIIDDEPGSAEATATLVQALGHEVIVAADADEGKRLLEATEISLVLVEWDLADSDGIELCRWVRKHFKQRYLYLIVMSGQRAAEAMLGALEAGADDCIGRPLEPHELKVRVDTARRIVALERELENKHRRLSSAYDQLLGELMRTTSDLAAASRLQQNRLPRAGRFGNIDVCGFLHPAMYNAGDVFDYFELGEDLFCFYVVDVVGHGTTAAMTSYAVRHLMRSGAESLCQRNLERCTTVDEMVSRTMEDLNGSFYIDEDDNQWFTMILGVVQQRSGLVTLCQGGHPPAIHIDAAKSTAQRVGKGGFSVAMFEDANFPVEHCTLAPGDRLAVYSDGLLDSLTDRGDAVAMRIMEEGLIRALALPFDELSEEISGTVFSLDRRARATDDISLVVLEYRPGTTRGLALDIACDFAELTRVELGAESLLEEAGAEGLRVGAITLALSEAVSNVIRHGCAEEDATIRVELSCSSERFRAVVVDTGEPMPEALRRRIAAREVGLPEVSADAIDALPTSGLGFGIILSTVEDIDYSVEPSGNRLTLSFAL